MDRIKATYRSCRGIGECALCPESRKKELDNNRKMKFDQMCREMWRDTVAEALEDDPDTEIDRDARLSLGSLIWISEMRGGGLMERLQS